MNRRDLLKYAAAAAGMPLLSRSARAHSFMDSRQWESLLNPQSETDRVLVLIWLNGGNDGLGTIIPFEDPAYDAARPHIGFVSKEDKARLVHTVRDDLALNPVMSSIFPLWQEGKMAIVQNVGLDQPDLSHFRATDIWNSASDKDVLEYTGWLARWLAKDFPNYPATLPVDPLAISFGEMSPFLFRSRAGQMDILVNDPQKFEPSNAFISNSLPDTYGGAELRWLNDLISVTDNYAKRFGEVLPKYGKNMVSYPDTVIASDLRNIAQCIGAGLKTRVYYCMQRTYDTHFNQNSGDITVDGQGRLLHELSDAMLAFQRDLEAQGVADRVITMTYSEFGRRVSENGAFVSGTDHGTSAPQFIIGTKVNGELYGAHPDLVNLDAAGNLTSEFEFRQMYAAVLGDWFDVPEDTRHTLLTPGKSHDPFAIDFPVNGKTSRNHLIKGAASSSVSQHASAISATVVSPFSSTLAVDLSVCSDGIVSIDLIDERGALIANICSQRLAAGSHQIRHLLPTRLPNGIYFVRIRTASDVGLLKAIARS